MKTAMVFAAGLGTRLRPLTETTPKPLVEISGKPMLGWIAQSLKKAGVERLVLNSHWLPEQIEAYAKTVLSKDFEVFLSFEPQILGTGGGLYQARKWLTGDFFLVNADVLTNLDFKKFGQQHEAHGAWISLAVNDRPAPSRLLLDEEGMMVGLERGGVRQEVVEPEGQVSAWNFCGIHAIGEGFLDSLQEPVSFSIIDEYLKALSQGLEIRGLNIDPAQWSDIGSPGELEAARASWKG